MKRTKRYITTGADKKWRSQIAILLLGFCFWSCTDELGTAPPLVTTDEAMVQLSITAQGASLPTQSQTAIPLITNFEYNISQIRILVFDQETDKFLYMVKGQQIKSDETNSRKTTFSALLKTSLKPIRLVLVANSEDAFQSYMPARGEAGESVRDKITESFRGNLVSEIPMYGEKVLPFLDGADVNIISVTLLRAVARVDVELDLDMSKSDDFRLKEVYIYRANDLLQVIPDQYAVSGSNTLKVSAPSVPATVTQIGKYDKQFDFPQSVIEQLYVPEAIGGTADGDYGKVTCVVVGGNYNGEEKLSYYRADFPTGNNSTYGEVLRNHKYLFKIKGVTGSGWETPDDAANNRSTLMNVDIKMWEDFTLEMYANGDNYLGITSRNLVFPYKEDLTKIIGVQATVPYKISWLGSNESTIADGPAVNNEYFSARIINLPGDESDVSHISITTRKENNTAVPFTATLVVEWSNWIFTVEVAQKKYSEATMRSIRVLTACSGTGALGAIAGGNVSGNMRYYLTNTANFSPDGKVDFFAGFSFAQLQADYFKDNLSTANLNRVKAEIYAADVIYLNNDNRCGKQVAAIIQEWLSGSPNRVLILGGDADGTSMGFLRKDLGGLLTNDVEWRFNLNNLTYNQYEPIQTNGTGTFSYYPLTTGNMDIMKGPFGDVNLTEKMVCADRYFGYVKEIRNKDIVPLLYHSDSPAETPYMSFGIDKVKRIFYHGDASVFEAGRLPSSTGVISTNNEIFWANVWAWIAYQVIWGDDELVEN